MFYKIIKCFSWKRYFVCCCCCWSWTPCMDANHHSLWL